MEEAMHYDEPLFHTTVQHAADCLMQGFLSWNEEQERLSQAGEESNFTEDVNEMCSVFRSIAERMVMEDVNAEDWEWLTTSWAGVDGNTGRSAYTIDFTPTSHRLPAWAVLSFYVTSNGALWFAIPLAEIQNPRWSLATCEANSVRQAIESTYAYK